MEATKIGAFIMLAALAGVAVIISTAGSVSALICTHPASTCAGVAAHGNSAFGHSHDSSSRGFVSGFDNTLEQEASNNK
jgi:protein involved in ribonucleotide reduction